MNGQDLLLDFYTDSFRRILGIAFKKNAVKNYLHIEDYLADQSSIKQAETLLKLNRYCYDLSPKAKTASLIEYLKTSRQLTRKLLDFGCGSGATLGLLLDYFGSIEIAIGIDADPDALFAEPLVAKRDKIRTYTDRSVLKENSFDLILVIHTLHHTGKDQQELILEELVNALETTGVLYLVEDSWSIKDRYNFVQNSYDKLFSELDDNEKIALFEANDFWSNTWCYGKSWKDEKLFYRTAESWIDLLLEFDLVVKQVTTMGFDLNRLHGVPSLTVIAQKRDPNINRNAE